MDQPTTYGPETGHGFGYKPLGRRRKPGATITSGKTGRPGRRCSDNTEAGLRIDAYAAAEILADYSDRWSPEQVLLHPEITTIAIDEAKAALKAAGKGRRRDKALSREKAEEFKQAAQVVRDAQASILFIE